MTRLRRFPVDAHRGHRLPCGVDVGEVGFELRCWEGGHGLPPMRRDLSHACGEDAFPTDRMPVGITFSKPFPRPSFRPNRDVSTPVLQQGDRAGHGGAGDRATSASAVPRSPGGLTRVLHRSTLARHAHRWLCRWLMPPVVANHPPCGGGHGRSPPMPHASIILLVRSPAMPNLSIPFRFLLRPQLLTRR
jgi:hypothetical protein